MEPEGFKRVLIVAILIGIVIGLVGGYLYFTGEQILGIVLVIIALPILVICFSLSKFLVYLDFYSSVKEAQKK